MRKEKTFKIGQKELTARELTVSEITRITDSLDGPDMEINDIDMLFPDRLPSSALLISMGMSREEIGEYSPSEIEIMIDAAEETNPTFAGLMQRLASVGRQVLAETQSGGQSAD